MLVGAGVSVDYVVLGVFADGDTHSDLCQRRGPHRPGSRSTVIQRRPAGDLHRYHRRRRVLVRVTETTDIVVTWDGGTSRFSPADVNIASTVAVA